MKKGELSVVKGRLVAGFTIKNVGSARAASSRASIATVRGGKIVILEKTSISALKAGRSGSGVAKFKVPKAFATGSHEVSVCADHGRSITEKSEDNNCLDLGTFAGGAIAAPVDPLPIRQPADVPSTTPAPATPAPQPGGAPAPTPAPVSTVPTAPVARRTDEVYKLGDSWVYVPNTYDASNQVPIRLLVWMHGCGGVSQYELYDATVGANQNYIGMAPGGTDGGCWDVNGSPASVLAQIDALKTHFNIDRRRVVLGGYSSGGDMSYRMALDQPGRYAGLLVTNTSPFRDSGATSAQAVAATTKFPIVHLAHLQDTTYPIAGVRTETDQLTAAGFPLKRIEVEGNHYDDAGAIVNGKAVPGTSADVKTHLLPSMTADWQATTG